MDAVTTTFSPSRRISRSPSRLRASVPPCLASPGFTFIEVLFAIIILGVGLIMIAGMIPVAIQQGQKSQEDLNGRILCDNGYALVRTALLQNGANAALAATHAPGAPNNNPVVPAMRYGPDASPLFFGTLQNDRISANDSRFMWFPFYQREIGSNRVNLIVLTGRRTSTDIGPAGERYNADYVNLADNFPQEATAIFVDGESTNRGARLSSAGISAASIAALNPVTDIVIFDGAAFIDAEDVDVMAPGAFVIVRQPPAGDDAFRNTGRIFRLGEQVQGDNKLVWTLDPAYDLAALANGVDASMEDSSRPTEVYVLGRGLRDPANPSGPSNPYIGPAQDVAIERYSFTIR